MQQKLKCRAAGADGMKFIVYLLLSIILYNNKFLLWSICLNRLQEL